MSFLETCSDEIHPAVLDDVRAWRDDPDLGALYARLVGHVKRATFLDTLAEALVARHLRRAGCLLRFEVTTPAGKACDFEVRVDERTFYLHVKRVDTEKPERTRLTISSRLRALEQIQRPYVVSVRWYEGTSDRQMQRLVRDASAFIRHARVGEELSVRDDDGAEIGGVMVAAPGDGPNVSLMIGLPGGFGDEAPRIRKLMRRAYRQFMPREDNLILVCSSHSEDADDFDRALLGSHVERWDAFPPRGRRVAHGRAADGLWHRGRYEASRMAGWFPLTPADDTLHVRLMLREEPAADAGVQALLQRIFPEGPP